MNSIDHNNIVKYYESFRHNNKKLIIILEYANGGDLNEIIKSNKSKGNLIDQNLIWFWFFQIASAIAYLHDRNIIHRDIKSQNIFVTNNNIIKLGDFGVSKVLENSLDFAITSLGTPYFLSPEICQGHSYNQKTDIWMLGCLLYELTTLNKPFNGNNFPELMKNIINCKLVPVNKTYYKDISMLINEFMSKEPENRPSIRDVLSREKLIKIKNKVNKIFNNYSNGNFIKKNNLKNNLHIEILEADDSESFNYNNKLNNNIKTSRECKEIKHLIQNLALSPMNTNLQKRYENKSIKIENPSSLNSFYLNSITPNAARDRKKTQFSSPKLHNIIDKENNLKIDKTKIVSKFQSTKNVLSNNPFGKTSNYDQIFISISAMETPKHRPKYFVENYEIKKRKSGFFSKIEKVLQEEQNYLVKEKDIMKIKKPEISISPLNEKTYNSSNLTKDNLRSNLGNDSYEKINEMIELEENPNRLISSENIKKLCGDNYNNIVKLFTEFYNTNKTPVSNTSTSTKSHLSYLDSHL